MVTEIRKQRIADALNTRMRKHRQICRVIRAEDQAIEDMAREYAEVALDTLVGIMSDQEKPARDRIKAACEILDRGFGRPVERSVIAAMHETDIQDYSRLDTRSLIALATKLSQPIAIQAESSETTPCTGLEKGED